MITDLLIRKDPFLIECFVSSKWPKKKFNKLKPNIIRKYMISMEYRYRKFRDFPLD